jgi:hypothetical protein
MESASFTKLVPGFDFLQGLVKNAGAALPSIGQWVAPTLDPAELEKRIEELRTVQFWLEQNARMLGATIQALEVQRMTLSTLKTMNVQMDDLRESLKIRIPTPAPPAAAPSAPASTPEPAPDTKPAAKSDGKGGDGKGARKSGAAAKKPAATEMPVDPMQWWGALTKQFTQLAASAMKDSAADAAKNMAGTMVKQGSDTDGQTPKKAAAVPGNVARKTAARKRAPSSGSANRDKAG